MRADWHGAGRLAESSGFSAVGGAMQSAVGFYWTLPVPWTGFTDLPRDVDQAARSSRTIRYQAELIRRHARQNRLNLVHEEVFLEIEPDRASQMVCAALESVAPIVRAHHAALLVVDFAQVQNWRSHQPLQDIAADLGLRPDLVYPDDILLDGRPFHPAAHFETWRKRQMAWSAGKAARLAAALTRASQHRAAGASLARTADLLNAEGLRSPIGRPWTADNLRKAMAAGGADPLAKNRA